MGGARGKNRTPPPRLFVEMTGFLMAVAVGFEPTVAVTPHSISSAAPSAARTRYLGDPRYRMTDLARYFDRYGT